MAQKFKTGTTVQLSDRASSTLKSFFGENALVYIDLHDGTSNPYKIYPADEKGNPKRGESYQWARSIELQEVGEKITVREKLNEQISKHQSDIKVIEEKINSIKTKLEYMDEVQTDEFNENEFKAYQAITIISRPGMSKIEQARALAVLISGK
jgi:hypothetical protein